MLDSRKRTLAKTLSWRFIATFITATLAYLLTGELVVAAEIGLLDTTVKLGAYYAHERAWLRVGFGRYADESDYQI